MQRAVLTRVMDCREISESDVDRFNRRANAALHALLQRIDETYSEHARVEPSSDDGLDHMVVPEGFHGLDAELWAEPKFAMLYLC